VRLSRAAVGARRPSEALETGPRVFLRGPAPRDASALAALARGSRQLHRPWVYPPVTVPAVARWIRAAGPTRRRLLVCRRADGAVVGVVNVNEIVRAAFQSAYLGYYAFRPHAGRGLMAEGLSLVLRHAFRRLGLHRLEANIQPGNRRSRELVRRLGFRREGFSPRYLKVGGRWRDHERWAIVRETWVGRAAPGAGRGARRPVRTPVPRSWRKQP
jgi:[ribosomal protein S5]-alanine N-acetyltransferase